MPRFVESTLESGWLWILSRILITFMYWYAGLGFLADFQTAQQTMTLSGFSRCG